MRVYLLTFGPIDGRSVLGVYSSLERARQAWAEYKEQNPLDGPYDIDAFDVDASDYGTTVEWDRS